MNRSADLAGLEAFKSHLIDCPHELDSGPGRYRLGLIALASDYVVERDFMNMRPGDDVAIYTSRVRNVNPCTVENLRTMAPRITESTSLIVPDGRLDVVAYACTSGTVVIGYDAVRTRINAARPGIACTTPISASLDAFQHLGIRRIAVLTPYVDDVNAAIARHLERNDLTLTRFSSFQIADDNDMAGLTPEVIHQAAMAADTPDAQALFISCTAIRAVDAIERIESDLGKPVICANQAMFWRSLRLAGCDAPVVGYGRLLAQ